MEQQSKHFLAMPIFSLEDGQQIGTVKEIVIDKKSLEISALIIEPKGLFREQKIIPYIKVKNVGNDAITIERHNGATSPTNLPNILSMMKGNNPIIGIKVITEAGKTLGYIEDYLIEDTTGKIVAFELGGKISGLLNGKARLDAFYALTLGKDALIVKAESEHELLPIAPAFKDNFKSFSNNATKWFDDTLNQTKNWSKSLGEKLSKIASEEMPARFKKKEQDIIEDTTENTIASDNKKDDAPPTKNDLF